MYCYLRVMTLHEGFNELLKTFEDRVERAKRINGYQAFSDYLHDKEIKGFSWGNLTTRRKEIRGWIEKTKNNKDLDNLHKFKDITIVIRLNEFIENADNYIVEFSEHDYVSCEWLVYYFYMPVKDPTTLPKMVRGKLKITTDSNCEFIEKSHEPGFNRRLLGQPKRLIFKGTYSQNKKKRILSFNLTNDDGLFLNFISSYNLMKDTEFQTGTFNRFDGHRIEAGRIFLTPYSSNLFKKYDRPRGPNSYFHTKNSKGLAHELLSRRNESYICAYHDHKVFDKQFNYDTPQSSFIEPEFPRVLMYCTEDGYSGVTPKGAIFMHAAFSLNIRLPRFYFPGMEILKNKPVVEKLDGSSFKEIKYHSSVVNKTYQELDDNTRYFIACVFTESDISSFLFLLGAALAQCKFILVLYESDSIPPPLLRILKWLDGYGKSQSGYANIIIEDIGKFTPTADDIPDWAGPNPLEDFIHDYIVNTERTSKLSVKLHL